MRDVSRSGDISWAVSNTKIQIHLFKPQTHALCTKHCVQGSLNYKAEYNQPDFPNSGLWVAMSAFSSVEWINE